MFMVPIGHVLSTCLHTNTNTKKCTLCTLLFSGNRTTKNCMIVPLSQYGITSRYSDGM